MKTVNLSVTEKNAYVLTLAGAVPFLAAGLLVWLDTPITPGQFAQAATSYAAVILSFLGGIQWGTGLSVAESAPKSSRNLLVLSVVPSILACGILFIEPISIRLYLAIGLFVTVWAVDALLRLQGLIPDWFFRVRSLATGIVVGSLASISIRL